MTTETKNASDLIDRYHGYSQPQSARFHALVDMLVAHMIHEKIAPDELRDAAFVASIKYLEMHPTNIFYRRDDLPESK